MALLKQLPLEERIRAFRTELDAFIDEHVKEIRKTCTNVPDGVVRQSLLRGLNCQCSAVLQIKHENGAENAA
jgi:hypothetical protein